MNFLCMVSILYLNIYPILGKADGEYYLAEMDNGETHLLEVEDQPEKDGKPSIQDPLIKTDTPHKKEKGYNMICSNILIFNM